MEFDKSKVYTLINADEVKIGSKGYFADTFSELKSKVKKGRAGFDILKFVDDERLERRFVRENGETSWGLFYLVEEQEIKKFRPYKDTDEMIKDFVERYSLYNGFEGNKNPMYNPLIWVQAETGKKRLITGFCNNQVCISCIGWLDLVAFADTYSYLDGTPCGIEE